MDLLYSGKVRDVYRDGQDIVLVASDRVSVFDVVLPTPIPEKGKVLTALSLWWFAQLRDIVPNHVISTDVPPDFAGRGIRCQRLAMFPVECVARGYLAGSGLRDYQETGAVCGIPLPPGLGEAYRLPDPIFAPTTKAPVGDHDAPMTFEQVSRKVGTQTAEELRQITLDIYRRGMQIAALQGVIIADTKIELGWASTGEIVLGDEVLTPDSSRFWPSDQYRPGREQASFDKQPLRDWAIATGWDGTAPGPEIPTEIVEATRARYVRAFEQLTGLSWAGGTVEMS